MKVGQTIRIARKIFQSKSKQVFFYSHSCFIWSIITSNKCKCLLKNWQIFTPCASVWSRLPWLAMSMSSVRQILTIKRLAALGKYFVSTRETAKNNFTFFLEDNNCFAPTQNFSVVDIQTLLDKPFFLNKSFIISSNYYILSLNKSRTQQFFCIR